MRDRPVRLPLFSVAMSNTADAALARTLHSGYIGQGPVVDRFERELADTVANEFHVVAVNSGTAALDLAFELIGLSAGDVVITTPMTCLATNIMLLHRGCQIVWADVDPDRGLIDVASVAAVMSDEVRAIVAVDWGGESSPVSELREFGAPIVQDAAHSMAPSRIAGHHGDAGDYVCWSFQAIKHLTCGDGGALLVRDDDLASRARLLRWFGLDRTLPSPERLKQDVTIPGFKYQMNDIAATLGIENLKTLEDRVARARENAYYLDEALGGYGVAYSPRAPSSRWLYVVLVETPARFIAHLDSLGIEAAQVHRRNDDQPCFAEFARPLPGVDRYSSRYVAIPVGWWLDSKAIRRIASAVRGYLETVPSGAP